MGSTAGKSHLCVVKIPVLIIFLAPTYRLLSPLLKHFAYSINEKKFCLWIIKWANKTWVSSATSHFLNSVPKKFLNFLYCVLVCKLINVFQLTLNFLEIVHKMLFINRASLVCSQHMQRQSSRSDHLLMRRARTWN